MSRKYLVLSDIHSNLTSLCAVLNAAEKEGPYEKHLCAGDVVGYGPNPNECIAIMQKMGFRTVRGNHDRAVVAGTYESFNPRAASAARKNRELLDVNGRDFLAKLAPEPYLNKQIAMAHGSFMAPFDSFYILESQDASYALQGLNLFQSGKKPILGIVGHTHIPMYASAWYNSKTDSFERFFFSNPNKTNIKLDLKDKPGDDCSYRLLFNPGSVGQPRDGDPRAAWGILEVGDCVQLHFRRTAYDIGKVQKRMRKAGFVDQLIERLADGT